MKVLGDGNLGNADVAAYFFLRAAGISESFGLLAVNTIAQGDTREVGLDPLVDGGWQIFRATKSRPWPGVAGVHISQVWASRLALLQSPVLNGSKAHSITSQLALASRVQGRPYRLSSNAAVAFQGSIVLGLGFIMDPDEAAGLIEKDPRNREVLFPYMNAEDLCNRPDAGPSRWVVNFFDWSIEKAKTYGDVFPIVELKVKPERQRRTPEGKFKLRHPLPEKWWQYADKRPALYSAISTLRRVIVMPQVSKIVLPVMSKSDIVFSQKVYIVARNDLFIFGVLSSTIHRDWARRYSSTLGTTTSYTPTDCFETFPFPDRDSAVEAVAETLDHRRTPTTHFTLISV